MAEQDWVDVPETAQVSQPTTLSDLISSYIMSSPQKAEEKIAARPSAIASLAKEPATIESLKQHPFKTPLKTVSGAWEMLEGIPADIGLALQKGRPQDILGDISKTLLGQRPAEIGDIYRGAGVPEPLAATGGLLLTALKGTPTSALGEVTMKPIVQTAKYLGSMAKQYSMPAITKAMKFMANIPESHSEFAIKNPELLHTNNLKQLGKTASQAMESVVVPLEDNPKVKIDLKPTFERLKEVRMTTKAGDLTSMTAKLSNKEQEFIKNTLTELQGYTGENKPTFSRVRFLLGRMDDILSPTYKKRYQGIEPVTDAFQGLVGFIRGALRSSINPNSFPEADQALKQYAHYEMAKNVANTFNKMNISFMKSLPIRLAIVGLGTGMRYPQAALMALPLTMPLAYKGLIGGADIGQKLLSEPTITLEMLEKMGLEKPQQDEWTDVQ